MDIVFPKQGSGKKSSMDLKVKKSFPLDEIHEKKKVDELSNGANGAPDELSDDGLERQNNVQNEIKVV